MVIASAERDVVQLTGEAVVDVRDFGMEPPRSLLLRVEPDVTVTVDITATTGSG
jgi:hypothetical protein